MINLITSILGIAATVFQFFTRRSKQKDELERLYKEAVDKYDREMKDHDELRKEVAGLKDKLKESPPPPQKV